MSFGAYFEDEDLALYALHLLEEPRASAVARTIRVNLDMCERFESIQTKLGLYAALQIDFIEAPTGSRERLIDCMQKEPDRKPMREFPVRTLAAPAKRDLTKLMPWIGWVLAVGLLLVVAVQLRKDMIQRKILSENTLANTAETIATLGETHSLHAQLALKTEQLKLLQNRFCGSGAGPPCRKNIQGQISELARTRRERDELRETTTRQALRVTQLDATAETGRKLMEVLSHPEALRILLSRPRAKSVPTARVAYLADQKTLVFLANNLIPLKSNRVYQLWLMPKDGGEPVPSGTFVPDGNGNASIVSTHFRNAIEAKGFAVTIEAGAHSKTPTLPIVLAGL